MERGDRDFAAAAASALDWWAEAGVDTLVSDAPRNWLQPRPNVAPTAPLPAAAAGTPPAQLDLFRAWLAGSEEVPFASLSAIRVVPAGDPAAGLMILVEMPTDADAAAGQLISGAAGRLFDRMLAAIGRSRDSIYLAALSCLRPPIGRLDAKGAERCVELARHHIGLAAPKAVLLFGDPASKALIGKPVASARGHRHSIHTPQGDVTAIATLHPETLLRQAQFKALAWADLQLLMEVLG